MTTTAVDASGLNDYFRPLNFDTTRTSLGGRNGTISNKTQDIPLKPRSIQFADEKQDAKILLETILLFENDDSFCDASVVEAVMEDFQDSCSSFDSWEYAHGGNVRDNYTRFGDGGSGGDNNSVDTTPSLSLMEIEQQVREQQAREFLQKAQLQTKNNGQTPPAVPLEILTALGGSNDHNNATTTTNKKGIQTNVQVVSPLNSPMVSKERLGRENGSSSIHGRATEGIIQNIGSPGVASSNDDEDDHAPIARKVKPKRTISSHKAIPKSHPRGRPAASARGANPNLRRALEKSSSLRMLEEAAANRRAREDEIRQRQEMLLAERKKAHEQEEDERLRQEDEAMMGENMSNERIRGSAQKEKPKVEDLKVETKEPEQKQPAGNQANAPPLKRASTHEPFSTPVKKEEESPPEEASGPALRRTKTSDETPVARTGRNPLRRNRTFDLAGTAKPTKAPPKRTASNFTGPRNMQLRRVRTHEPMVRRTGTDLEKTKEETNDPAEETPETSQQELEKEDPPPTVETKEAKQVAEKKDIATKVESATETRRPRRVTSASSPPAAQDDIPTTQKAPKKEGLVAESNVSRAPRRVVSEGVANLRAKLEQKPTSSSMENAQAAQQKRYSEIKASGSHSKATPRRISSAAVAENVQLSQQKRMSELQAASRRDSSTTQSRASSAAAENAKLAQQKRLEEVSTMAQRNSSTNESKASTSSAAVNAKLAQQRRYQEIQAVEGLSVVGANAFNARERMVVTLQSTTRGYLLRHAINAAQAKIRDLQNHLKAMQRSKLKELMSISHSPELKALREEYQAATMTANEIDLEKRRSELRSDLQSVIDENADIQQKMEDLKENSRRIAKVNRELNYQISLLEDRNATLQATRDHLQSKVDELKAKAKHQENEISTTIRQTQTEKKIGRICHATILRIREHTKEVAAQSDDAFLKKVHRRAQVLEKINKDPKKTGKDELCPVIMS